MLNPLCGLTPSPSLVSVTRLEWLMSSSRSKAAHAAAQQKSHPIPHSNDNAHAFPPALCGNADCSPAIRPTQEIADATRGPEPLCLIDSESCHPDTAGLFDAKAPSFHTEPCAVQAPVGQAEACAPPCSMSLLPVLPLYRLCCSLSVVSCVLSQFPVSHRNVLAKASALSEARQRRGSTFLETTEDRLLRPSTI